MAYYEMMPAGLPAGLQSGMDSVLNKKFGTATSYAPGTWPDTVNLMGPLPEKTIVPSPIADFSDGADDVPTKALVVTIPPTLSGKSEVTEKQTGRNLLDMTVYDGGAYNPAVGTTINLSVSSSQFTKTGNAYSIDTTTSWKTFSVRMPVKSGVTYYRKFTMSASGTNLGTSEYYLDADNKVVGSVSNNTDNPHTKTGTLSIPSGALWFVITFTNRSTATNTLTVTEPQIEIGSTAHAYEPYTAPTTYTAQLGRTVYGGEVDIVNGTGKESYTNTSLTDKTYYYSSSLQRFDCALDGVISSGYMDDFIPPQGYTINHALIIDGANAPDYTMCIYGGKLYIKNLSCSNVSELVSDMNGKYITYSLATPTDFTFTGQEIPTRLGYNAFWSDEGDTSVTYRADISLALQALSGSRGLMMARPQLEPETEPEETIEETPEEMER